MFQTVQIQNLKQGININIALLIVTITLVSTASSLGAGLMMYFESLKSLEGTIKEVSNAECDMLRIEIRKSIAESELAAFILRDFFASSPNIIPLSKPVGRDEENYLNYTTKDSTRWSALSHWYLFSTISRSNFLYGLSINLGAWNHNDQSNFYSNIWYGLKSDDSREYVWGRGGKVFDYDLLSTNTLMAHSLDENGMIKEHLYNYTNNRYVEAPEREKWNPSGDITESLNFSTWPEGYVPDGWSPGPKQGGAIMHYWREPKPWYASDKNAYVYMAYDVIYAPPPPPHALSSYRYIWVTGYLIFSSWEKAAVDYGRDHHDTHVVILDIKTSNIYASSDGKAYINQDCFSAIRNETEGLVKCITAVVNMSETVQDAWSKVKHDGDIFRIAHCGGEKHFVRRASLFSYEPPVPREGESTIDAVILWLRPQSSVEKEVFRSLLIFIGFGASVLVFDVLMAALELSLVALPLRLISDAVTHIQVMDLSESLKHAMAAKKTILAVDEVNGVCDGLLLVVYNLQEFKTFMPSSLFVEEPDEDEDEKSEQASSGKLTNSSRQSTLSASLKSSIATRLRQQISNGTVCCFRVVDLNLKTNPKACITLGCIVGQIQAEVGITHGQVHAMNFGDSCRIDASWGLSKRVASSEKAAAAACLKLKAAFSQVIPCCCLYGSFTSGNIGNSTLRGFFAVSPGSDSLLPAMLSLSVKLSSVVNEAIIIVSKKMDLPLQGLFDTNILCCVAAGGHLQEVLELGPAVTSDNSWMMQPESEEKSKQFRNLMRNGSITDVGMEMLNKSQRLFFDKECSLPIWYFASGYTTTINKPEEVEKADPSEIPCQRSPLSEKQD